MRFAVVAPEDLPPQQRPVILDDLWRCYCPQCGIIHGKQWHVETDLCNKMS